MVRAAFPCGYNHLHYGITKDSQWINPLEHVGPEPDGQYPVISELHFVKHGVEPLSEFGSVNNCPTVSGSVDVIVKVSDKDDAGSTEKAAGNLGIYDLRWRACAAGQSNCVWQDTHKYDAMPAAWGDPDDTTFKDRFTLDDPLFPTIMEEWSDEPEGWTGPPVDCEALPAPQTIMFVAKDGIATWKTQEKANGAAMYKNGPYTLSVKALDYAGNDYIYETTVCVKN
jgi:hypothetical protein